MSNNVKNYAQILIDHFTEFIAEFPFNSEEAG